MFIRSLCQLHRALKLYLCVQHARLCTSSAASLLDPNTQHSSTYPHSQVSPNPDQELSLMGRTEGPPEEKGTAYAMDTDSD